MKRRDFLKTATAAAVGATTGLAPQARADGEQPLWTRLPRWRGFNLLEKFYRNDRFVESDFQWITDWGFDFVRLPMDYRQWTDRSDPHKLRDDVLAHVDEAVEFGGKYGVHVCLNLHNAPGYTVNRSVKHTTSLWTDAQAQQLFAFQWEQLARRYRGTPSSRLSFNLVNEPANIAEPAYVAAVLPAIEAIRRADPDRLILSDGLDWGKQPIASLRPHRIAQMTRGYTPFQLTHYKASWAHGSDRYPTPQWPVPLVGGHLFGPVKKEWHKPLIVGGPFPAAMRLRLRVDRVSSMSRLVVRADDRVIFDKAFKPGPGEGEWKTVVHKPEYNTYQNIYDRDYTAEVPAGTTTLRISNDEGDWLTLSQIALGPAEGGAAEHVIHVTASNWGQAPEPLRWESGRLKATTSQDRDWLRSECVEPWRQLAASGVGAMVGEWGSYNKTPHDVVLRWAEDLLSLWREAGLGWALWNLRGPFGVVDSQRADVAYEEFGDHKLDGQLLKLLRAY